MRIALCMGINDYKDAPLRGCVNDASDWAALLTSRGYDTKVLLNDKVTRKEMISNMSKLVCALTPGDTGVIFYAGHGTWVPDMEGDEVDGRDEALCPYDYGENNLLIDDDIAKLWTYLKPGARAVFITDACNSGTVFRFALRKNGIAAIRYLPPGNFVRSEKGVEAVEKAQKYRPTSFGDQPIAGLVHFGACLDTEYAGDGKFGDKFNGAFSHVALDILKKGFKGSYYDLISEIKKQLPSFEYQQTPVLNANSEDRSTTAFP